MITALTLRCSRKGWLHWLFIMLVVDELGVRFLDRGGSVGQSLQSFFSQPFA